MIPPVSGYHALIPPLSPENVCQEFFIFGGSPAIYDIVGGHDGPGIRFPHHDFKTFQINFPQSPLGYPGVALKPAGFFIVAGKMLHRGSHFPGLDSPHHSGSHLSGHQRILRIVFKVSSAERASVNVHGRCQPHADIIFQHLQGSGRPDLFHQFRIPGAGQQSGTGKGSGIYTALRSDAQSRRAVRRHHIGNAPICQISKAKGVGHSRIWLSPNQSDQFIHRKLLQKCIHGTVSLFHVLKLGSGGFRSPQPALL